MEARDQRQPVLLPLLCLPGFDPFLPVLRDGENQTISSTLVGTILNDHGLHSLHRTEIDLYPGIYFIPGMKSVTALGLLALEQALVIGGVVVDGAGAEFERRVFAEHLAIFGHVLVERGFRHFAYFSLVGLGYVTTHQNAFVAAVTKGGGDFAAFAVKPQAGAEPDWRLDLTKLGEWVKELPKPVAIFCWNASGAREVVMGCQSVGLHVPEEVAVLSQADDDVLCEAAQIPISGVRVAADTIGFQAAKLLHRLMRGAKPPNTPLAIAPLSIVQRQSTDTLAIPDPVMVKALSFIRQQVILPVRVNDVARHAGVSRRALERRFMEQLQRTPAAELRRFQLDRARQLLTETNLSMSQVAEKTGFGSQAYFAAVFRTHFSQSPRQFRRTAIGLE